MHSIRPRPICRFQNAFSPSVALWQHFVAPCAHLWQRPPKSLFTTEASQGRDDTSVASNARDRPLTFKGVQSVKSGRNDRVKIKKPSHDRQRRPQPKAGFRGEKGQNHENIMRRAFDAYSLEQAYEGVIVRPVYSDPLEKSTYPWVVRDQQNIKSGKERLNLEIRNFHEFIRPTPVERVVRNHVVEQVRQHVKRVCPGYVLETFGSERTGVAFAISDIDLRMVPADSSPDAAVSKLPPNPQERRRRKNDLMILRQGLVRLYKNNYLLPTIRWARYPLISLQDRKSGLDVQLVSCNDTSASREYMHRYIQEYPYLPEVYSVLKTTLDVRGLTDVFRGGIGSYSLFMMIVASLKHKPHPSNDAAGAVEHFLLFWAKFKTEQHGVSIEPPELFDKAEQAVMQEKVMERVKDGRIAPLPKWMLTLRDPADHDNDLGRKTVAWKHIQVTFQSILRTLRAGVKENTRLHREKLARYGYSLVHASNQLSPTTSTVSEGMAEAGTQTNMELKNTTALNELAAIARAIRNAEKQPAGDKETLEPAEVPGPSLSGFDKNLKQTSTEHSLFVGDNDTLVYRITQFYNHVGLYGQEACSARSDDSKHYESCSACKPSRKG
ncbi:hypothetical protein OPT61_g2764 [Boeremia exigua]|uniref:Uncharacterized protein n=1 Tax=Boeremia exigua TaxID=749465 RepID=A0ACC2IKD2_9PLEO|nr:hypothetical protein OPT61_g2764 [Boeremia exigua]